MPNSPHADREDVHLRLWKKLKEAAETKAADKGISLTEHIVRLLERDLGLYEARKGSGLMVPEGNEEKARQAIRDGRLPGFTENDIRVIPSGGVIQPAVKGI